MSSIDSWQTSDRRVRAPDASVPIESPAGCEGRARTRSDGSKHGRVAMGFITYENRRNPHVTVHVEKCSQIRKHGGEHAYDQGEYHSHATFAEAQQYATQCALPIIVCSYCRPSDVCDEREQVTF